MYQVSNAGEDSCHCSHTGKNREKKTFECLEKFCEDSGLRKTVTLERALNMYMDEYYGKIGQSGIVLKG